MKDLSVQVSQKEAEELIRKFPSQACQLIGMILGKGFGWNAGEKQDLIHDIYLKMINYHIKKYDGSTKLITYIGAIAKQAKFNYFKGKQRRSKIHNQYKRYVRNNYNGGDRRDKNPLHIVMANEMKEVVVAIDDDKLRHMIQRRFIDEWTLKSIATEMNCSIPWVQNCCNRWLEKMKFKLRKD